MRARAQGWYADPYGIHGARWVSDGRPTGLVRDEGVESRDEPPHGEPPAPEGKWRSAKELEAWPAGDAAQSLWQRPWMVPLLVVLALAMVAFILLILMALSVSSEMNFS